MAAGVRWNDNNVGARIWQRPSIWHDLAGPRYNVISAKNYDGKDGARKE